MKLKLDENLPETLIATLSALGFDVDSVRSEGLEGRPDPEVWKGTQQDGRMLLTQDLDFGDAESSPPAVTTDASFSGWESPGFLL